jgi:hypothetical protein
MLEDEGTLMAFEEYMTGEGKLATGPGLANAITDYWRSEGITNEDGSDKELADRTATEWMNRRGYKWTDLKKGVYKDGHERPDVLAYRNDVFLPRLAELEPTFVQWTFPHLEEDPDADPILVYPQNLPPGVKPRVPVTHDESSFNSKDGIRRAWVKEDYLPFYDKGRGTGIMASEYLTPGGNLKLPPNHPEDDWPSEPDGDSFNECTQLFEFGDGQWWDGENVVAQLKDLTIPLFEKAFPGCQAVFLFDCATNHTAFAHDALRVEKMNLSEAGAQDADMKDGWFIDSRGTHHSQKMHIMRNGVKVAKGMEKVLRERGLRPREGEPAALTPPMHLTLTVRKPQGVLLQCSMPNPNHSQKTKRVKNPTCAEGAPGRNCYATAILSAQPDFKAQRSRLEEAVEGAGHIALFYPKYHCEMNWIEYYWGACKKYARKHCTYTLPGISPSPHPHRMQFRLTSRSLHSQDYARLFQKRWNLLSHR